MANPSFVGETGEAPRTVTHRMRHTAEAAAGTDFDEVVCVAGVDGNIAEVRFIPDAAMSGATATATTLSLINKTGPLTPASLAFITSTDLVAFTAKKLTLGAAAQLVVLAADVLTFKKTHASTGTAGPSGIVEVDIARADTI